METVDLAFEELGRGNKASLLILHGFFASSRNWRKIAENLSATFHVYVLDIRNHGASPHHGTMDYPAMAADVLRFLDAQNLRTAHVLGHSMGGKIAMWLALNHAECMNKLIVVDIAPKSYTHSFSTIIQALIDLPLTGVHNRKQADTLLANAIPEADYRQFLLQNLIFANGCYNWRVDLEVFLLTAPNIAAFPNVVNLVAYHGKTLFVAGEHSKYIVPADITGLFPDAEFITIAQAGHWVHAQQPDVFTEVVENFLQRG